MKWKDIKFIFPDSNGIFTWTRKKNLNFLSKEFIKENCQFIASKTGKNYYPGTNFISGRINPENLLCFSEERQAINLGLKKGK